MPEVRVTVPIRTLDCGCYYGERVVLCPSHQPDVSPAAPRLYITEARAIELSRRLYGLMTQMSRPTQTEILINLRAFLEE